MFVLRAEVLEKLRNWGRKFLQVESTLILRGIRKKMFINANFVNLK